MSDGATAGLVMLWLWVGGAALAVATVVVNLILGRPISLLWRSRKEVASQNQLADAKAAAERGRDALLGGEGTKLLGDGNSKDELP